MRRYGVRIEPPRNRGLLGHPIRASKTAGIGRLQFSVCLAPRSAKLITTLHRNCARVESSGRRGRAPRRLIPTPSQTTIVACGAFSQADVSYSGAARSRLTPIGASSILDQRGTMRLTPLPPAAHDADGWRRIYMRAADRNGTPIGAGTRVRVLCLSGQDLDDLPLLARHHALAMVGEVYEVEDIDPNGPGAWIRKSWADDDGFAEHQIAIALEPHEMEAVADGVP